MKIVDVLSSQHLFLYDKGIIDDYSNVVCVEMYDDMPDELGNPYGWEAYENDEGMKWDEVEALLEAKELITKK